MIWLVCIILGAIAGWIASMIGNEPGRAQRYILMGIAGSFIGVLLFQPLRGAEGMPGVSMYGYIVALLGALIFIWITRIMKEGR